MKNKEQTLLEKAYEQISQQQANKVQGGTNVYQKTKTFGDLLKLIQGIQIRNKGGKLVDKGIGFAVDQVLGLIPGASNAKTAFDFLKTAFERPDTKKTGTVIDRLNVDDQVAAIVDKSIEQNFLSHLTQIIKNYGVDTPIPPDWNITKELQVFLQKNFKNRTIELPSHQ